MTFRDWIDMMVRPAGNLPAADRVRLFRQGRIVTAGLSLALFPLMVFYSSEPTGVAAALLLFGLLPAVLAMDRLRPARLDRASFLHVLIVAAVLTGGVIKGLAAPSAIMLLCLTTVEAFILAGRKGRLRSAAVAVPSILIMATVAGHAAHPGLDPLGHVASSAAAAFLALCATILLIRGLALIYNRERGNALLDRMLSHELETVISETVLAVDRKGHVSRVSANAERVLGLSRMALLGRGLIDLTLVADRPALLSAFADTSYMLVKQTVRVRLRLSADDAAPRYRWVALGIEPLLRNGVTMTSIRDVTDDVMEEERLRVAAGEAETARNARSSFLSTVNHELRTPLNAIIGFSEILSNPATTPKDMERVQEYATIVNGAGRDLLRMVSAMIDITRLDSGVYEFEAEDTDLKALVEAAVDAFRQEPDAHGETFEIVCNDTAIQVPGDARALRTVLGQLLSNAAKFGAGKGVTITLGQAEAAATVTVTDRGSGIAAEKLELLGRHFARLDETLSRDHGGIGLGLSLAHSLIALHRGRIGMESSLGKGTSVTLHLPRAGAELATDTNVLPLDLSRRDRVSAPPPARKGERKRA